MAGEYLAMYLTVKFDITESSICVPIRLFAESIHRLNEGIRDEAYFTTMAEAQEAMRRVVNSNPFRIFVLFDAFVPERAVILKRKDAQANMTRMYRRLSQFFAPPAAPVIGPSSLASMSLRFGMKTVDTPYPESFALPQNFKGEAFSLDTGIPRVDMRTLVVAGKLVVVLCFHDLGNQSFFGRL